MSALSRNAQLASLEVGEFVYWETTEKDWMSNMRNWAHVPAYRRPEKMRKMRFTASRYTAVGPAVGDIRYLIRVERTA